MILAEVPDQLWRRGGLRLPASLADFRARGFRIDRPSERAELETHCRSFVHGFNAAGGAWRDPHPALSELPSLERGFAYEGAAMRAALRDRATGGRPRALAALLDGPGAGYVHLVHVGHGWGAAVAHLPVTLPPTPLLRWLALDGAGFAETFFGGLPALRRRARRSRRDARWALRLSGAGRALWFAESADVPGVAAVIGSVPVGAQPHLWSGVGLASAYAGCAGPTQLHELYERAGGDRPHYLQGVLFAAAARARSGLVPEHTAVAVRELFGVGVDEAAAWTDDTSADLLDRCDAEAYELWRARLRSIALDRVVPTPVRS